MYTIADAPSQTITNRYSAKSYTLRRAFSYSFFIDRVKNYVIFSCKLEKSDTVSFF